MDPQSEVWIRLKSPFGFYDASNLGRIRRAIDSYVLSAGRSADGYCRIPLSMDGGGRRTVYVHRLVASAFCDGDQSLTVNHKNLVKDDNRAENLEWVSFSENHKHMHRLRPELGERIKARISKPVLGLCIADGIETRWASGKAAAIALGNPHRAANISFAIAAGRTAYGHTWRMG